jgi:topoisomerase IA-like protein
MGNKMGNGNGKGNDNTSTKSDDKILCRYNGENVVLKNGRYGEYLRYGKQNYNIQGYLKYKKIEADMIKLDDFETIIQFPKKICKHKNLDICIHIGPYGYYMRYGKKNIKIDQDMDTWTKEYVLNKIG